MKKKSHILYRYNKAILPGLNIFEFIRLTMSFPCPP